MPRLTLFVQLQQISLECEVRVWKLNFGRLKSRIRKIWGTKGVLQIALPSMFLQNDWAAKAELAYL